MTGTREEKVSGKEEGLFIQAPEGGETRESTSRKNTCFRTNLTPLGAHQARREYQSGRTGDTWVKHAFELRIVMMM